MNIADLRKSYEKAELNENASHADPLKQFEQWLQEAISSEVPEPNAMTLATVANNLRPSTRVVLIKGYDDRGIVWYTNYDSQKGQELGGNPFAALQFHWVELERVVRIEGRVEKVSAEESDAYFHSRPLDSRIGAWASPQSQVIDGRTVLVTNAAKYAAQFMLQLLMELQTIHCAHRMLPFPCCLVGRCLSNSIKPTSAAFAPPMAPDKVPKLPDAN